MPEPISPDSMMMICAGVCLLVIGLYALGSKGSRDLARFQRACEATEGASYAEAMRYLDVSENYPPGMLVGAWGDDPAAAVWWWRCSLCREHDLWLDPEVCANASAGHVCSPIDLEAAKEAAKRQHPAYQDRPEHWGNVEDDGNYFGEIR